MSLSAESYTSDSTIGLWPQELHLYPDEVGSSGIIHLRTYTTTGSGAYIPNVQTIRLLNVEEQQQALEDDEFRRVWEEVQRNRYATLKEKESPTPKKYGRVIEP